MIPAQYTLADIKRLRDHQQAAHRGRSIYTDMRSITEDRFRNALENQALPIIEQLLQVIEKQQEALEKVNPHIEAMDLGEIIDNALTLGEPWIEKDKHQQRLNARRKEDEQRSR
jgi:hypothetical protein